MKKRMKKIQKALRKKLWLVVAVCLFCILVSEKQITIEAYDGGNDVHSIRVEIL
ncbi:MAG: hypothetical protein HFH11_05135 [Dorea sp.]|nr:hypothetical protein [Dorea sp.]